MVIDIGDVSQSVSYYRPSVQSCKGIYCGLVAVLKLNFGFPNLGERGPLWGRAFVVSDKASVTSYILHYKAFRCLLWFCRHI